MLSELNTAVDSDFDGAVGLNSFVYSHFEGDPIGHKITNNFSFIDGDGLVLTPNPGTVNLVVEDGSGAIRTSDFTLVENPNNSNEFFIQTNSYFYFGKDAGEKESYTFTLTCVTGGVIDPTPSSDIVVEGELQNTTPSIDNDNTETIQVTIGKYLILDDIQGRNGSNDANSTTEIWRKELLWSITDIPDGLEDKPDFELLTEGNSIRVVNNNPSANGTYTFKLNVQDLDGVTDNTITTSEVFTINFGIVETDNVFTEISEKKIENGEGRAVWFTNSTENLLGNNPFENEPNFAYGLDSSVGLPSANDTLLFQQCSNTVFEDRKFYNSVRYSSSDNNGALTKGYFYVFVTLNNTYQSNNPISTVATSLAVSYRENSNQPWSEALDMLNIYSNSQSAGNWRFDPVGNPDSGMYDEVGVFQPRNGPNTTGSFGIFPMTVSSLDNSGGINPLKGARILAFNIPGEYRVILGNITTNYPSTIYKVGYDGEKVIDCDADDILDRSAYATMKFGDLYHLSDENIKRNSSTNYSGSVEYQLPEGVYQYVLYNNIDCDTDPGTDQDAMGFFYAKEPFTKYVTQLYTDTSLTNTAFLDQEKRYKIIRLVYNNDDSFSIYNPENVKNGYYKLTFNVNGTRIPNGPDVTSQGICLYPNQEI